MTGNLIHVALCCNEPRNGSFAGKLFGLEISNDPEFLKIESCIIGAEPSLQIWAKHIQVGRRFFPYHGRGRWVGNWCWDSVGMTPAAAADLVNYVMRLQARCKAKGFPIKKFSVEVGAAELFEKIQRGELITEADLATPAGQERNT